MRNHLNLYKSKGRDPRTVRDAPVVYARAGRLELVRYFSYFFGAGAVRASFFDFNKV